MYYKTILRYDIDEHILVQKYEKKNDYRVKKQ